MDKQVAWGRVLLSFHSEDDTMVAMIQHLLFVECWLLERW